MAARPPHDELAADSTTEPAASLVQYSSQYGYSAAGTATGQRRRGDSRTRHGWLTAAGAVLPLALLGLWWWLSASGTVALYRLPSLAWVPQLILYIGVNEDPKRSEAHSSELQSPRSVT